MSRALRGVWATWCRPFVRCRWPSSASSHSSALTADSSFLLLDLMHEVERASVERGSEPGGGLIAQIRRFEKRHWDSLCYLLAPPHVHKLPALPDPLRQQHGGGGDDDTGAMSNAEVAVFFSQAVMRHEVIRLYVDSPARVEAARSLLPAAARHLQKRLGTALTELRRFTVRC